MDFKRKVKFLNHCEENIDKLSFYLDISDRELSCGPCLILKHYYNWVLKNLYELELAEVECEKYFLNVIEKLDYKVIANMEYEDFRDLVISYYSLGEIYFGAGNLQKAKEYFTKVTDIIEESLKLGNKYQTEEIKRSSGVILFELLMWARKNLGDLEEGTEALELYESIIGEDECLYVEKCYSIYKTAKQLNIASKVNESARGVIKIMSSYKGVNIDSVEYLMSVEDYENAIDIVIDEYIKNDIAHWINVINIICRQAHTLNLECVHKIIRFNDLVLKDLKIVEWSTVLLTLYRNIKNNEENLTLLLDYIRSCFNKVNRNDFVNCSQAISVLQEIYDDIRVWKYEKEILREYEFDFTMYLMNVALQSQSYERGLESSAKLEAIMEVENINNDVYSYVNECFEICKEKVITEEYKLDIYPWNYLYDNIKSLYDEYGIEEKIKIIDKARNSSEKIIVGINVLEDPVVANIVNEAVGDNIFYKHKDIIFISNENMKVNNYIEDNYDYEVIVKADIFDNNNCCIMTYENAQYARLTDVNVILVDGHRELRDMDITYINHILHEGIKSRILILVNTKARDYNIGAVNYNETIIKTLLNLEDFEIIDMATMKSSKEILNLVTGKNNKGVVRSKFESFNRDVNSSLTEIENDIKAVKLAFKEKRYTISECGKEYAYIQEELENNHREFKAKVKSDIDFLREYVSDKIISVIPDLLETRLSAIDDLEEVSSLKDKAEDILSRTVESWCSRNIYKLMLEQFQVYIAKYSKFYRFHQETIDRISENRKVVIDSYPEFKESMATIEVKSLDELLKEFLTCYEDFLQSINYKISVIPNENIFSAVKDGIKVIFLKPEEKAENLRAKIKSQVVENKKHIASLLINNIEEKLQSLEEQLEVLIFEIFKDAIESIAKEKAMVEGAIEVIDNEFNKVKLKNEVVETKMRYIKIETLKYKKEINCNLIYSNDKCYSIK